MSKSVAKRKAVQNAGTKITAEQALAIAQEYFIMRQQRLDWQHKVDAMEVQEKQKQRMLMDMLQALKINSVGDTEFVYALVTTIEPTAEDWEALWAHVKATGEFDLLYKRVNPAAVKERWEQKIEVPGVKRFPVLKLSVTKAK